MRISNRDKSQPETTPRFSVSDRRTLASAKANFTRAILRGTRPLRSDLFTRINGETVYRRDIAPAKALAIILKATTYRPSSVVDQASKRKGSDKQPNRPVAKAFAPKKVRKKPVPSPDLRIWKHSHGGRSFEKEEEREKYRRRRVITLHRDTGKQQGLAFREHMSPGDFFYLCHGNRVQLVGQITSNLQKASRKWVERRYQAIRECRSNRSKFLGRQRKWTPNYNSTCVLVPPEELNEFERSILLRFFNLRLRDLETHVPEEPITADENDALASLPKKKYEEARRRLVLHKRFEKVLTRNRKLVREAKKYFKAKHGKLFCEGCEFDFQIKYGIRGRDFIEAHHSIPIAEIKPGTKLQLTDLNMVCANCHRMLHRAHWITLRELQKEMRAGGTSLIG